jgi:ubiquinone/menaquinone biosynthesis C-methylase UbiE
MIKKRFDSALIIGTRNGYLAKMLLEKELVKKVLETDLSSNFLNNSNTSNHKILTDEELLPFRNESFDLVVSNLSLNWVNDLPGSLVQIKRMLKKSGFFCANMFGGKTLQELRSSMMEYEYIEDKFSPRISPFIDVKDGAGLLQRTKFEEPVSVSEDIIVKYNSVKELLTDIRNTGEANALAKLNNKFPGKKYFDEIEKLYKKNFSDNSGNLDATFEIVTISGWKK